MHEQSSIGSARRTAVETNHSQSIGFLVGKSGQQNLEAAAMLRQKIEDIRDRLTGPRTTPAVAGNDSLPRSQCLGQVLNDTTAALGHAHELADEILAVLE